MVSGSGEGKRGKEIGEQDMMVIYTEECRVWLSWGDAELSLGHLILSCSFPTNLHLNFVLRVNHVALSERLSFLL